MDGAVVWYHPALGCALIEHWEGLTLGMVEGGDLGLFDRVRGDLTSSGPTTLWNVSTGHPVAFTVEGVALSEDQANELVGLLTG
ncbi:hypothetical protein KPL74_01830 [Bacillus sp. NP157]|nr:hypothetical protein KPL74_01830 [Bacillus sp. NP157]